MAGALRVAVGVDRGVLVPAMPSKDAVARAVRVGEGIAVGEGPLVSLHLVAVALVLGVSCAMGGEGVESGAVGDGVGVEPPSRFGVAEEMDEESAEGLPPRVVCVARPLDVRDPA